MTALLSPRLGVNIDHIATLRQLRGTPYPSLTEAARLCEAAGAAQITVHLREDRRHIQDQDVKDLRRMLSIPLNLEMGAEEPMVRFARKLRPDWVCLVPERRQEVTTEGGLNLKKGKQRYGKTITALKRSGIRVSLFIEPSLESTDLAAELGADAVEFHTGVYCRAKQGALGPRSASRAKVALEELREAAERSVELGLGAHAGHGFDFENVRPVAALERADRTPLIVEYNIGHAIVCRAALVGLERAVREMLAAIEAP